MHRSLTVAALLFGLTQANIIVNPGFEDWANDSTPAGWRIESRSRTRVTCERDSVRTGAAACRLTRMVSGTGNNSGLLQQVAVAPNTRYYFGFWCQDNSPLIAAGMMVTWRRQDSSYLRSTSIKYSADAPGWQLVRDSAVAPESAALADVIIRTYGTNGAPAGTSLVCDDASFASTQPQLESIRVWFVQDSLAQRLIAFFDSATASIDYCCYNSSRPDVTLALIRAHNRGVRVRVITDNTRLTNQWVSYLRGSGITVWSDSGSTGSGNYMHNKFAIRDLADNDTTNDRVWNASYNPNDGETNADYGMELPSSALAQAYRLEFNQMWGDTGMTPNPSRARFHSAKTDLLPTHQFTVCGAPTYLYFSPQNRVVDTIEAFALRAGREIGFAVNAFTYNDLGIALLSRHSSGCRVFGTFDRANVGDSASEYHRLRQYGVPVLIDSVPFGTGTLHEKIMVIDSEYVVCGSANWSNNANYSNDENTLIIRSPNLARLFMAEIIRRYLEAGGTYPPGILEQEVWPCPTPWSQRRQTILRLADIVTQPTDLCFYDVTGRQIDRTLVRPGIHFVRRPKTQLKALIIAN